MNAEEYFSKLLTTKHHGELWYHEGHDKHGYFYNICAEWVKRNVQVNVIITSDGVSLDYFEQGTYVHTNIIPKCIFGEQESLSEKQLEIILNIIVANGVDGVSYDTKEEFQRWLDLGKP